MSWTHRAAFSFLWDSLDSAERLERGWQKSNRSSPVLCLASGQTQHCHPSPGGDESPGGRIHASGRSVCLFYFLRDLRTSTQLHLPFLPPVCCNGSWGTAGQRLLNGRAEPVSFSQLLCSQASSSDTCSGLLSTAMLASICLCCALPGSTVFTQRANLFHLAS